MAALKRSSSLSKYLDTRKAPTRLVGPLERHLLTRPVDTSRRQDVIHPSALCKADFCVRASYFVMTGHGVPEPTPGLRLQSIFDEGHSIHHKWQSWLRDMGVLYGRWQCMECDLVTKDMALYPGACGVCGSANLRYAEVALVDAELMIEGKADGWIKGLGADCMIEIKSIGPGTIRMEAPGLMKDTDLAGAWRNIRRPFPTHVRQGLLYLELARRMEKAGLIDVAPTEIVFLYELKMDQAYKEFTLKADPAVVKDMLDLAYDVAAAVRKGTAPRCSNMTTGPCKSCKPYGEEAA